MARAAPHSPHVLRLHVHATPGARQTAAAGARGDALRVRLAAAPVDGKANAALLQWVAEVFAVPQKKVQLLRGAAARQKMLAIELPDAQALQAAHALWQQMMQAGATGHTPESDV